jgi:hypothetical protein
VILGYQTKRVQVNFRDISLRFLVLCGGTALVVTLLVGQAPAQERMKYPDDLPQDRALVEDNIASSELMETERGRELVEQLRVLRIAEATMGEKHPLLPKIKEEIRETKALLRNWTMSEKIAGEMESENDVKRLAVALPSMSDEDLRRLVLRLIIRVDILEKELKSLKGNSSAKSLPGEPMPKPNTSRQDKKKVDEKPGLFDGNLFDDT